MGKGHAGRLLPALAILLWTGTSVTCASAPDPPPPAPASAPISDPSRLRALAHDYYEWRWKDQPVAASNEGLHAWDSRITDYSPKAIAARRERPKILLVEILNTKTDGWSVEDRIAHALLRAEVERAIFEAEVIRRESRDPGLYVDECSNAIFSLVKKDYAPKKERVRAAWERLRAIPAMLDAGFRNLTEPVPILARLAVEAAPGVPLLIDEAVKELSEGLRPDQGADLAAARDRAVESLRLYAAEIEKRLPAMKAPLAMGKRAYGRMLARVHLLPVGADEVASLGRSELARAKELESRLPDPDAAEVRGPAPGARLPRDQEEFLRSYEARTADLVAHLKRHDLATIPGDIGAFKIEELPRAFRPTSPGGFMNPPGLFDADPTGFYFIPTYDPKSVNFYVRAAIQDPRPILGHEGIPGHFLQLSIARKHPDEIRRMHQDGVFVEGWAHYTEEMLLRTGLYEGSPGGAAQVLRLMRYRAARITVDVMLHTGAWDFDHAVEYFITEGGLDREAATGEAAGAASTPGQKIHYTLGKWQIQRLLERYRERKGAGFSLRAFHDELLSQGSVPLSLAAWAMLGDDAAYRDAVRLGSAP